MFKRLTILLLLAHWSMVNGQWSTAFAQTAGIKNLYKLVSDTYETKADSMTNAFIESFMIKNKGIFNDRYQTYAFNAYWTQAHAIDVIIYGYQRHKSIDTQLANTYRTYMTRWYDNKANNYSGASTSDGSYRMFENPFTDDMCWITLALFHMYEATGTIKYLTAAKNVFDQFIIKRANEDEATGGLWLPWNTDQGSGPNACTQSPATLIAAKLYQKYGTEKYLEYAKKLYTYAAKKFLRSDGSIEDPPLTYTQGTFGEACRILYHITDESNTIKNRYKANAYSCINYAFTSGRCTNGQNILRDEGHDGNQSIFKAVLIPYAVNFVLDEDMTPTNRTNICKNIQKNASTMWKNLNLSRYPLVFCNYDWTKPYTGEDKDASMGAMCSGASLMENSARMCRAIIDRYDLGTLYTECSKLVIEPGHEDDTELSAFNSAMAKAEEILANPSNYTTYQFRQAIEKLEAAYLAAQDYATGIPLLTSPEEEEQVYDLSGRQIVNCKLSNRKLPRGLYIVNGKKVLF